MSRNIRRLSLVVGTVAMTLLMAACGNNAAESGSSQSGNVSSLTNEEIIIGTVNEPTSMERNVGGSSGVSETTTRNVYEGLTSINDAGEVVNTLAENIDISEDGLTYTITLRPDVTFHDGTPLTSKDAAWVVSEAIAPESKSARASDLRVINKIETPDEQTLVLALDHKTASLPFFLASITVVKEGDKENTSKNGTGPYKLVEWVQGDHLTLEANPNYWGDAPKNPGVTFQFFTDETALDNALRTGAVDIVIQQ